MSDPLYVEGAKNAARAEQARRIIENAAREQADRPPRSREWLAARSYCANGRKKPKPQWRQVA